MNELLVVRVGFSAWSGSARQDYKLCQNTYCLRSKEISILLF